MAKLSKFGIIHKSSAGGLILDGFDVDMEGEQDPADLGGLIMKLVKEDLLRIFSNQELQQPVAY